jgi:RNA polymerase sigma-70 factor (ECF subfamily)
VIRRRVRDLESLGVDNISVNASDLLAYFEHRDHGAESADLLSETMMTAWRRIEAMPQDPVEARMWLFGIARRVRANSIRTAERRVNLANKLRDHLATTQPSADDDRTHEVREAVSQLPADLQELIGLVHWDGFSIAEAAALIGIPASTARTRYQTARQRLAKSLSATTP